ncbi:MAG: glycosyltransferase family 39 protein [Candidatus Omnitrophota bacterium]
MEKLMRSRTMKISLLGLIMLLGFALRSYNIDFPAIGYHNMKENDYLSMAQEMQRTGDYVTRRIYFWNAFEDNPTIRVYPQPPLISYQILLCWKTLGENLWGPRLINVLFGVAAILIMYLIAALLFKDVWRAMYCSLLLAIMPLAVFFSRNLQPESQAFFFMLLGSFFYLKFIRSFKAYNLLLGGIAFSLAWLYKFSFLIAILPIAACLPYKKIFGEKKRALFKYAFTFILPYLIVIASILWMKRTGQWQFEDWGRVRIFEIFSPDYWKKYGKMIWWYARGENFTVIFTLLATAGIILAFVKRKGLLNRYIIGSALAVVPYSMFFSDYVNQHNYYQMPFLALVCLAVIYAVGFFADTIKKLANRNAFILIMAVVVIAAIPPIHASITRMFATVFLGQDVAGESLNEFTAPDERIFLFTYPQGYAIARYARRYVGWASGLEDFKQKEQKFNMRYVCFYPAEFAQVLKAEQPDLFNYLKDNYHVKEVGLTEEPGKLAYIIMERGKPKPEEQKEFLQSFSGNRQLRTIYKLFGRYIFFYSLRT